MTQLTLMLYFSKTARNFLTILTLHKVDNISFQMSLGSHLAALVWQTGVHTNVARNKDVIWRDLLRSWHDTTKFDVIFFKKKPGLFPQKTEPRPCKRRCYASSLFLRVKNTAIREYDNYNVIPDDSNGAKKSKNFIVCNNVFFNSNDYVVNIATIPTCSCPYYMENKNKQICKYIVIVLLSLGVGQNDALLFQVGYTASELETLLNSDFITFTKQSEIAQQGVRRKHIFYLGRYLKGNRPGRRTGCAHCKRQLNDGLVVEIDGKYRYAQNSFNKTFLYCLNDSCLKNPPRYSDIKFMPTTINGGYSSRNEIDEAKQLVTLSII